MGDVIDRVARFMALDRRSAIATLVAMVAILVATAIVLVLFEPANDVLNFYDQAMRLKDGQLPYADFEFEFPPLALLFFAIPGIFTSDLVTYSAIFAFQCAIFQMVAIWCVAKMVPEGRGSRRVLVTVVFAVLMLIYISESVKKFDGIVMALTVISLFFFSRGRWGPAYAIMAVSAFTKMYPGFLLVLMLAYNIVSSKGGVKAARTGIVAILAVAVALFVPLWIAGVSVAESLSFIEYHAGRGFQVESTVATAVQILGFLGLTEVQIVPSHYTHDVVGPITDALSPCWVVVCMFAVALALVFCICRIRHDRGCDAVKLSAMAMVICTVFMLTNKVFSTQYMMWIFPFIAMMCAVCRFNTSRMRAVVALTAFLLIQLVCMVAIGLDIGSELFVLSCATRDVILVLLLVEAVDIIRSPSVASEAESGTVE